VLSKQDLNCYIRIAVTVLRISCTQNLNQLQMCKHVALWTWGSKVRIARQLAKRRQELRKVTWSTCLYLPDNWHRAWRRGSQRKQKF